MPSITLMKWNRIGRKEMMCKHLPIDKITKRGQFIQRHLLLLLIFFVKNNKDEIVRNNPGMNSEEISNLAGIMFKTLSEKKKQKYVDLARVEREKYEKQVQQFKEENPDLPKPVEISEKMEAPLAPTPFSIFCSKKKSKRSITWCTKKFPSLSDSERLKWIDLALAQEASYVEEFQKFKAENPSLNPKMTPVLNDQEKRLVYMRDVKPPVKPPHSSRHLFISEFQSITTNEGGIQNRMKQWSASWNALSQEEKKIYKTRLNIMKNEYDAKWRAYLSKLPVEKRQEEIAKHHPGKKGERLNKSSPKMSKPTFSNEKNSKGSVKEDIRTLLKKNATKTIKEAGNKSSSIAVDSSADSDKSDDTTLPKKKLAAQSKLTKESSEESKKDKFVIKTPFPRRSDPNESDSSSTSSSDDEAQKLSRASSTSTSCIKMVSSVTKRSKIQSEENTSDEDDSDSSGEETSSMTSGSKPENRIRLKGKITSSAVDSSYESYSDDSTKLFAYSSKFLTEKHQREIPKYLLDVNGMKRKKAAEMDKSGASFKKLKTLVGYQNDSSEEEEPSMLPTKAIQVEESGYKSCLMTVDSSNEFDESDDDSLSNKNQAPPKSAKKSSDESSDDSESEPEQSSLPKKRSSMLDAEDAMRSKASDSNKKANLSIVNPTPRIETNGSDPSSSSSSDDKPQEMNRSSSSSFKSGRKLAPSVTKRIAIQNEEDTSEEYDSSSDESSDHSKSEPKQSSVLKRSVSIVPANPSSLGTNDSRSLIRPVWALQQKLYKNEPPKPPKTAAEWHAFEILKVSNIPEKKKKDLWNRLSEKMRKKLEVEHTKRLEDYEEKLQSFKKVLSKTELQVLEHIKRLQRADSEDDQSE